MKNSKELEKHRGVVVFAFNSTTVDYVKIGDQTSKLINKNLDLPVTLITDNPGKVNFDYDKIIYTENIVDNFRTSKNQNIQWRNLNRYLVYELSPYQETILLDTDYLVLDKNLNKFWEQDFDYKIVKDSYTPKGVFQTNMGHLSHDWLWATVVFFRKTLKSKLYFDLIGRIQNNYGYYKTLFNLQGNYRNDFAFAVADLILNGYTTDQRNYLPYKMLTLETEITNIECQNKFLIIREPNRAVVSPIQNLHIMDKNFLQTEKFINFIDHVTA